MIPRHPIEESRRDYPQHHRYHDQVLDDGHQPKRRDNIDEKIETYIS